jgi:hypothetical protein
MTGIRNEELIVAVVVDRLGAAYGSGEGGRRGSGRRTCRLPDANRLLQMVDLPPRMPPEFTVLLPSRHILDEILLPSGIHGVGFRTLNATWFPAAWPADGAVNELTASAERLRLPSG